MNQEVSGEEVEDNSATQSGDEPTVVGIGASAGGLAALKQFFQHVPENSGLAFVVVVHLSPDHESHLAELLQPNVPIPVQQVTETTALEANRVFVIPPNRNLSTIDTHLRLSELEERRIERAPIDHFFRTLAATHDGHAIGVILTGTGNDGTLGIREIKGRGGLAIVQDPNDAEYDGMPQSAIATGMVDLVLPLSQIPDAIINFVRTEPKLALSTNQDNEETDLRRMLQKIFMLIHGRTGRDFGSYKRSTLLRRITRRMQLRHLNQLEDYLTLLRESPEEIRLLSDDLLITVTNFFRDPEVFNFLEQEAIPNLLKSKKADDTVRLWSVGCASGEEAYSLAILMLEAASRVDMVPRIQIFASDLHEHSLARAREGFYPGDIETDVTADRLSRFFQKEEGGYRICREVRELVVFAPHNLLGDPPFSKLDLVTCRNVLIYLQRDIQRDIIELFHYSLLNDGYLILGSSETIESLDLFASEQKKLCVYRKRNVPAPDPRLPVFPLTRTRLLSDYQSPSREGRPVPYGELHQQLVERYALPSILISPDDKVVHLSETAGRYLTHPGGELTNSIFKLIAEELRIELRAALHVVRQERRPKQSKPTLMSIGGDSIQVVLQVRPALQPDHEGFALLFFDEYPLSQSLDIEFEYREDLDELSSDGSTESTVRNRELLAELELTKQRLQAIIEEYETSQEEMKASNEELQSANEELRSTMEELETSKEELQSMNEELQTVNQENRHKVEQLAQLSSDLQNLLTATDIATLFLDRQLRIMRFTPKVGDLFNVRLVDRGRSLFDFTHRLGYDELATDAKSVLKTLVPVEREVQDDNGNWYLTRVLPYRSSEDKIEGVVITLVDITAHKRIEEALRQSEERYRLLIENAHEYAIILMDHEGCISMWNRGANRITGFTEKEAIGELGSIIFTDEDNAKGVFQAEIDKAAQSGYANDERWQKRKDGTAFWASGSTMALRNTNGGLRGFAKVLRDNTEQQQAAESLREAEWRLRQALEAAELGTWNYDPETGIIHLDSRAQAILKIDQDSITADALKEMLHPEHRDSFLKAGREALDPGGFDSFDETHRVVLADGEVRWLRGFARVFFDENQQVRRPVRAVGVISDVTTQLRYQEDLRQSESRYRTLFESIDEGFCVVEVRFDENDVAVDYKFLEANPAFEVHTGLSNAVGHWMTELISDMETHWFEIYGRIAKTGVPERFAAGAARMARFFDVYAFRVGMQGENKVAILFTDITERKKDEDALRASETRLRLAAQATGFGSYDRQFEPPECVWSEEVTSILGLPRSTKAQAHIIVDSIVPEDKQKYLNALEACTQGEDFPYHDVEFRIIRPDGQTRWLRDIGHTFFDGEGGSRRAVRLVGMIQDITEQKEFERSLELARSRAEAANRMRGEFLTNMSHEIRTPMAAILGYADVLLEHLSDPDDRGCVLVIKRNGEHLLELINDILDLSRIEAGKLEVVREEFDLPQFAKDVHTLMEVRANEKRLALIVEFRGPVPQLITADATRLRQVLFNLLGNAIKFTERGEVRMSISLTEDHEEPSLEFSIRDTGIGMSAEQQSRLFQPFSQGDSSITRVYGGSGLGLAISKRLTRMLGGDLTCESEQGEGSTFSVRIPIGNVEDSSLIEPNLSAAVDDISKKPIEQARKLSCRVLVVDDRRDVRFVSQHFLEKAGAHVSSAENGLHGVEAVLDARTAGNPFDLIVMDMQMPLVDGLEATSRLRAAGVEAPIIALTADAMKGDRQRCIASGCDDYLAKPIDPAVLVEMVARYTQDITQEELNQRRAKAQSSGEEN